MAEGISISKAKQLLEQIHLASLSDAERAHHLRDQLWEAALETAALSRPETVEVCMLALRSRSLRFRVGYAP